MPIASGLATWSIGTASARWVAAVHGVAGLAVVWWCATRWRSSRNGTVSVLFVAVALTAGLGVVFAAGVVRTVHGTRLMAIHVGLGLFAIVPAVAVTFIRGRVETVDIDRRRAIRQTAEVVAGAVVVRTALEGVVRVAGLPGADRRFTGSFEVDRTASGSFPVTQWLGDAVPRIDPTTWRLTVHGPGGAEVWSYDQLASFTDRVRATIDCTAGWFSTQDWEGVRLDRLLPDPDGASSIEVRSLTGYRRWFPIGDREQLLVATRVAGRVLEAGHGHPVRLVAPGRRGFWWVKWVDAITLSDRAWWWQPPFPLG